MVKTVKNLLKKAEDPYLALLSYRTTPLPWCRLSPASLLMGRELRSSLPQTETQLTPDWPFLTSFRKSDAELRDKQKVFYDRRHRVHSQNGLLEGTRVWVKTNTQRIQGTVLSHADTPRSYWIETHSRRVRRNRRHLTIVPNPEPIANSETPSEPSPVPVLFLSEVLS